MVSVVYVSDHVMFSGDHVILMSFIPQIKMTSLVGDTCTKANGRFGYFV